MASMGMEKFAMTSMIALAIHVDPLAIVLTQAHMHTSALASTDGATSGSKHQGQATSAKRCAHAIYVKTIAM